MSHAAQSPQVGIDHGQLQAGGKHGLARDHAWHGDPLDGRGLLLLFLLSLLSGLRLLFFSRILFCVGAKELFVRLVRVRALRSNHVCRRRADIQDPGDGARVPWLLFGVFVEKGEQVPRLRRDRSLSRVIHALFERVQRRLAIEVVLQKPQDLDRLPRAAPLAAAGRRQDAFDLSLRASLGNCRALDRSGTDGLVRAISGRTHAGTGRVAESNRVGGALMRRIKFRFVAHGGTPVVKQVSCASNVQWTGQ